ncbi:MAG TPA: MarR family winged helix-turn-helix transcriptional regulator [Gemmatimonadales bacterium]|jgi:DNA-binding MarR family transcriptional regulator|nr:MarR family winged helix-turn-helix transcriptional regulator [Gemmatimonadales bacterium]
MGAHTHTRRARTGQTSDVRTALDALRRIVQGLRLSAAQAERQTGLTGAQLFVLQQLADAPAESLNELAQRTRTHQSSVSTVVTRLVARGLVSRRRDPVDGRRLVLDLTATGKALLADAPETAQKRLIGALERLSHARLRALASDLQRLVAALGMDAAPAPLFFEPVESLGKPGRPTR